MHVARTSIPRLALALLTGSLAIALVLAVVLAEAPHLRPAESFLLALGR